LNAINSAIAIMKTLNRIAGEEISRVGANALTDVTGFGLLGHLRNIVAASNVGARVFLDQVPVLSAAREYVQAGIAPGGTHANHKFLNDWVAYAADVTKQEQLLLCDAQTSGGLLAAVAPDRAADLLARLHARGVTEAAVVGRIESENPKRISVTRDASI
jgi:selenide,water dikinase